MGIFNIRGDNVEYNSSYPCRFCIIPSLLTGVANNTATYSLVDSNISAAKVESMSVNTLYKISNALHVSNDFLILGTDNSSYPNEILFAMLTSLTDRELEIAEKIITLYIQGLSLKNE